MTGNFSTEELSDAYKKFSERLFNEIKSLKEQRESAQLSISTYRSNIKTLSGEKRDLGFVVDNADYIKSVDGSKEVEDSINALILFQEKGYTENTCIPGICDSIFNSEKFSEEINRLKEEIDKTELKNIELKEKIDELEDLRSSKMLSIDLVREYAKKFEFDPVTYRKIMLSYLRRGSKKTKAEVVENTEVIEETVNEEVSPVIEETHEFIPSDMGEDTTESVVEETSEEFVSPFGGENNGELFNPFAADLNQVLNSVDEEEMMINQEIARETEENKAKYYDLKDRYDSVLSENNNLLTEYYVKIEKLSPVEKYCYGLYNEIEDREDFQNYSEGNSYACAYRIFKIKEEIEALLQTIKNNGFGYLSQINELDIKVRLFNAECTKLNLWNSEALITETAEEYDNSPVYYLINTSGDLVINKNDSELMSAFAKLANYDRVDSFVRRRSIKTKNNNLGTIVCSARVDKSIVNFIRLSVNDNDSIMVLNGSPLSNGYEDAQKIAENLINQYSLFIKAQIPLIINQDSEYLEMQAKVREQLLGTSLSL